MEDTQKLRIEYDNIKYWFDTTYTYQEQKYNRLCKLKQLDDDNIDPEIKLLALYNQAETYRKRIQELEKALSIEN